MSGVQSNDMRPPCPPFVSADVAARKVRMAEDAWNSRNPGRVSLAYTPDSVWRNRDRFLAGRREIVSFLETKWAHELDYRLVKELWCFDAARIAVRFAYEWHDTDGNWYRSYGNEMWEFDRCGLMRSRHASINDMIISPLERRLLWPAGARPTAYPELSALGL